MSSPERILREIKRQKRTIAKLRKQTADTAILKRLSRLEAILDQQAKRLYLANQDAVE